jgi:hypothetical protein
MQMKSLRAVLVLLVSLTAVAGFAQSDAQKSFDKMKTLAGTWEGRVTTNPPMEGMGKDAQVQVTLHITSRGNALVHEMKGLGDADDPAKNDHPVTMFYLEGDKLMLTHYCDAGNRPRMAAQTWPEGKPLEFSFVDLSGGTQFGHMDHAAFTTIDGNHHVEDWIYMMPGDKPMHAHMDLQRVK